MVQTNKLYLRVVSTRWRHFPSPEAHFEHFLANLRIMKGIYALNRSDLSLKKDQVGDNLVYKVNYRNLTTVKTQIIYPQSAFNNQIVNEARLISELEVTPDDFYDIANRAFPLLCASFDAIVGELFDPAYNHKLLDIKAGQKADASLFDRLDQVSFIQPVSYLDRSLVTNSFNQKPETVEQALQGLVFRCQTHHKGLYINTAKQLLSFSDLVERNKRIFGVLKTPNGILGLT